MPLLDVTHVPIRDEHGAVAYVLQHAVDVTMCIRLARLDQNPREPACVAQVEAGVLDGPTLQEANLTLEIERRHLRGLFQQAPGFMCFLRGPDHVFEMANAGYSQLVGHREIFGKPIRDALPDLEGQGFFELLDRVFTTGEAFVGRGMRVALQPHPGAAPKTRTGFHLSTDLRLVGRAAVIWSWHAISVKKRQEAERAARLER